MFAYSKDDIIEQLKSMNAPQDSIVIMHSSLSAIGNVEGGAENLLDILIEYFTDKGGLFCVPTHTWLNVVNKEITSIYKNSKGEDLLFDDYASPQKWYCRKSIL